MGQVAAVALLLRNDIKRLFFIFYGAGDFHLQAEEANEASSVFWVIFLAHGKACQVGAVQALATFYPCGSATALEEFQLY